MNLALISHKLSSYTHRDDCDTIRFAITNAQLMGIVDYYSYTHRSNILYKYKRNRSCSRCCCRYTLVHPACVAAIRSMHASSAGSLQTWPPGQAAPQFHHCTRNFVANCGMALVVVSRRRSSVSVAAMSCSGSLGRGSGSGRSWGSACSASATAAQKTGLEARTSSRPRSTGGAGSSGSAVSAAHERHVELMFGWLLVG